MILRQLGSLLIIFLLLGATAFAQTQVSNSTKFIQFENDTDGLAIAGTWTSTYAVLSGYGKIGLIIDQDQSGNATQAVQIIQTMDEGCADIAVGSWTIDYASVFTFTPSAVAGGQGYSVEALGRCAAVIFTNGGTASTFFRAYFTLKAF